MLTVSVKSSQDCGAVQSTEPAVPVALGATNGPPVQVLAPLVSVMVPAAGLEPNAATAPETTSAPAARPISSSRPRFLMKSIAG